MVFFFSRGGMGEGGSLDHCLQGTFAIVIKNICRYQHKRRLECMLMDKRGNADVKCA